MKQSPRSTELTKHFEQCRLTAYWDGTFTDAQKKKKRWTIGWGETLNICEGDACTQEEADAWLAKRQADVTTQLLHDIPQVMAVWDLNYTTPYQWMFDAVADFTYNLGIERFHESQLRRQLITTATLGFTASAVKVIGQQFLNWTLLNGEHSNGLLRRRLAEQALFVGDFKGDGGLKLTAGDFPDAQWFAVVV